MKKISFWAKHHKRAARIIIIVSFLLLNVLGIVSGSLLASLDIVIPVAVLVSLACIYCAGFIAYPSRSLKGKTLTPAAFYVRQKTCDLLLAGSTFLMIIFLGNRPDQLFPYDLPFSKALASNTTQPKDSTVKTYKTIAAFSASLKDENGKSLKWKERKKLLKEQVKAIKQSKETSKGVKVLLIILSVIAAIGLLALILALACDLSCSGSDGAAILVGVGGVALVIFLLVIAIRAIKGQKKKPKPEKIPEGSTEPVKN